MSLESKQLMLLAAGITNGFGLMPVIGGGSFKKSLKVIPKMTPPRNSRCYCGSGRKWKHCCGSARADQAAANGGVVGGFVNDGRRVTGCAVTR